MDIFNKQALRELQLEVTLYKKLAKSRLDDYKELHSRHNHVLAAYETNQETLKIAQSNEELLNEQCRYLASELQSAKSVSFPTKRFNISKAIDTLTKDLSPKALATFNYQYINKLAKDQVESISGYCSKRLENKELSTTKEVTSEQSI